MHKLWKYTVEISAKLFVMCHCKNVAWYYYFQSPLFLKSVSSITSLHKKYEKFQNNILLSYHMIMKQYYPQNFSRKLSFVFWLFLRIDFSVMHAPTICKSIILLLKFKTLFLQRVFLITSLHKKQKKIWEFWKYFFLLTNIDLKKSKSIKRKETEVQILSKNVTKKKTQF